MGGRGGTIDRRVRSEGRVGQPLGGHRRRKQSKVLALIVWGECQLRGVWDVGFEGPADAVVVE